jgi:hypothetical protein
VNQAVTVEGADTLARTLKAAARDLADLTDANRAVAGRLRDAGARTAPRRTGRLAGSVRALAPTADTVTVVAAAPYAKPIHFGVGPRVGLRGPHNIRSRPWLYAVLTDRTGQVVGVYADAVDSALGKVRGTA